MQCNPHQNSEDILHRDRKINPKVHMEAERLWIVKIVKAIPKQKNNAGSITIHDSKLYHWSIVMRTTCY
jgi:hypothetical protein